MLCAAADKLTANTREVSVAEIVMLMFGVAFSVDEHKDLPLE